MTAGSYTSMIIPSYNGLELLKECVDAIRVHTPEAYEIIVVDDGSTDGTAGYCIREKIAFISLPRNCGYPAACNYGLKIATGDTLLVLNNDVIVSHNWLTNQLECLRSRPEIGIVGPMTNYASGKQKLPAEYETVEEFHELAQERNRPDPERWKPVQRLIGMSMLFKREVLQQVGLFDERFSPGHYEDDDYCYRTRMKGYQLMIAGDVIVHHRGSASFHRMNRPKLNSLVHENRLKFIRKWSVDPAKFM